MQDRYIIEARHESGDWFQDGSFETAETMAEAAANLWESWKQAGAPECRVTYLCADTGTFRDLTEDVLWLAMQDDMGVPLFETTAFNLGLYERRDEEAA